MPVFVTPLKFPRGNFPGGSFPRDNTIILGTVGLNGVQWALVGISGPQWALVGIDRPQ